MPCYKPAGIPGDVATAGRTSYRTEAECLQACKEGACCEGTTCSVKPQCQCQGTGKTFKGVGTVCEPNPCGYCGCAAQLPQSIELAFTDVSVSLSSGSGNVAQKASEIEHFLEQISPMLTLQSTPSQSDTAFSYVELGCGDNNAVGCVSCPPDFRSLDGGFGGGIITSTLGLTIWCSGSIAASAWPAALSDWRVEKPGSVFQSFPCGQVRHLISMIFSSSPGNSFMCSSPPDSRAWSVAIDVRSADFGANGVPEANYTGSANVTATFNYANPLP